MRMFWSLRTYRRGFPENFLNLIFNAIFMLFIVSFMYFPCSGSLLYKTCSYKFFKIHRKHVSARLSFQLSCRDSACSHFTEKETLTHIFFVNLMKVLRTSTLQNTAGRLRLCFVSFSEFWFKKLSPPVFQKQ